MSRLSDRRARIARVRSLESRLAAAELAVADTALANLYSISARVLALRNALNPAAGYAKGLELRSLFETGFRLDHAKEALRLPISAATQEREEAANAQRNAKRREDGALRLRDAAHLAEQAEQALRVDANRPFIKRSRGQSAC
jgi:hypothetical protein